jgi:hypothetical protein
MERDDVPRFGDESSMFVNTTIILKNYKKLKYSSFEFLMQLGIRD